MIKIYHNNRCSKSRCGLELLEKSGKAFEVVKYLEDVPNEKELRNIIKLLNIKPIDLVRKNETIWKENFKNKDLSDAELIKSMVENPKLIERPIVINGNKAVIGRPTEEILKII
jgi:arsenate reductase